MPVFIGSTPNTTEDDLKVAEGIIDGSINVEGSLDSLTSIFQKQYPEKRIFLFNRGRDSMYFLFQNLSLSPDDEVIVQAFTCIAVVAPILWVKCKPVFVDIDRETFNMDISKMEEKITEKTRTIIIQHTFGNIVDMQKVRGIVDRENEKRNRDNKILLLEDCAHVLDFENKEIGKYSDAFFFSFAQDKSISSTHGALLVVNNGELLGNKIHEEYEKILVLPEEDALYNAKYILYWDRIKKNYFRKIIVPRVTFGKGLLLLYRLLGKIKKQASNDTMNFDGIHKMSEIQAKLLLSQFEKLKEFNENRKNISRIYGAKENTPMLRYPLLVQNRAEVKEKLKNIGVISGNWYTSPIFPIVWNNLECLGYKVGECPEAEYCARHVMNLPTNIEVDEEKAREILEIVNMYAKIA